MLQTDNIVKKVKSKAKSCIDQDRASVDSPAVEVVFGRADPVCVCLCVFFPDCNAVSAAICLQSGELIDFLLSMWMAM